MKSIRSLSFVLILTAAAAAAFGFETIIEYHTGHLGFVSDRSSDETAFKGTDFPWGLSLYARNRISEAMGIETGVEYDPVLRYTAYTRLSYHSSMFTLGVGPFFGLFNTTGTTLRSGIVASVRFELPGIMFIEFRSDNSIGGWMAEPGDYTQERSQISLGWYMKNAICSLNLETSGFSELRTGGLTVHDDLTEYMFKADLFKKNVPYTLLIALGYRQLEKSFVGAGGTTVHGLGSLVVGTKLTARFTRHLSAYADLVSSVYSFGMNDLFGVPIDPARFLFTLTCGVTVDTDIFSGSKL
jgi:hypothetical protein